SALSEYLASRQGMARKSWALSPAAFDEDGNPTDTPSYNAYGDYILYRPNAASDAPLYGLPVPYVATYYGREQYLEPFCRELARFTEAGVRVFYTWSPRNENALSPESDAESIAALERYFQENIPIPFLTSLQSSLLPGRWFYGTDNHLTTEGAKMRTGEVAAALRAAVFTNP
ncbi:MAG: leucine-rich repeat protein, partial [bacterium]